MLKQLNWLDNPYIFDAQYDLTLEKASTHL